MNRHIEDLNNAKITPIISDQVYTAASMEALTSRMEVSVVRVRYFKLATTASTFSAQINHIVSLQSHSREVTGYARTWKYTNPKVARVEKKYAAKILGLSGSVIMATQNAASIKDIILYRFAGTHYVVVSITPGKQR